MERLWRLLAHSQGQTLNASGLAGLLDLRSTRLKSSLKNPPTPAKMGQPPIP